MTVLSTAFNTEFTPTKTVFRMRVSGRVRLLSKNSAGDAEFAPVMTGHDVAKVGEIFGVVEIANNVAGAVYKVVSMESGTTYSADE